MGIIHAEGVALVALVVVREPSSIIHAAGVRGWVASSAPKAHREVGAKDLRRGRDPFELAANVLEIVRADSHAEHLLDDGEEIGQRTNRAQWWGIRGTH